MSGAVVVVKGPGRVCLDALFAHEQADARVRWLELEGSTPEDMIAALERAVEAKDAYEAACIEWHRFATDATALVSSLAPAAPHAADCTCAEFCR